MHRRGTCGDAADLLELLGGLDVEHEDSRVERVSDLLARLAHAGVDHAGGVRPGDDLSIAVIVGGYGIVPEPAPAGPAIVQVAGVEVTGPDTAIGRSYLVDLITETPAGSSSVAACPSPARSSTRAAPRSEAPA